MSIIDPCNARQTTNILGRIEGLSSKKADIQAEEYRTAIQANDVFLNYLQLCSQTFYSCALKQRIVSKLSFLEITQMSLAYKSLIIRPLSCDNHFPEEDNSLEERYAINCLKGDLNDHIKPAKFIGYSYISENYYALGAFKKNNSTPSGLVFFLLDGSTCEIIFQYVDASCRRQGIGTILLTVARSIAKEAKMRFLKLNPSEESIPFYFQLGFVPSDLIDEDEYAEWRAKDPISQRKYLKTEGEHMLISDLRDQIGQAQWQQALQNSFLK